jgi:Arc/MetJ-type ribon-helix-helix transcriptional regulator
MPTERVTVTLPAQVVEDIDRQERNRSRFVLEAVERELKRRRRELLRRSLANPHPETSELADAGFEDWGAGLGDDRTADLVDTRRGTRVRWVPGRGWVRGAK